MEIIEQIQEWEDHVFNELENMGYKKKDIREFVEDGSVYFHNDFYGTDKNFVTSLNDYLTGGKTYAD